MSDDREAPVREVVHAFYTAFDQGFVGPAAFATDDWNHVNPGGEWARGREAVLQQVREAHETFLEDVTEIIEEMAVRFATPDVAVVTVISIMSPFTTPDGVEHVREHHIRSFVVVYRDGRWLLMHDQNTEIAAPRPQRRPA